MKSTIGSTMRKINRCLNKQLADLCKKSIELEELSHKVSQFLPDNLASACHVGSFTNSTLVLATENAAAATHLRYVLPELRDKLRSEGKMYQLRAIKLSVLAPTGFDYDTHEKTNTGKAELSDKAKANIIAESEQCTYEPLKKALLNLTKS